MTMLPRPSMAGTSLPINRNERDLGGWGIADPPWRYKTGLARAKDSRTQPLLTARVDGQLHQQDEEQPNTDDAVDLEECLVDTAEVIGADEPVLAGDQHRDEANARQVD